MEEDRIRALDQDIHAFSHVEFLPATGDGPLNGMSFGVKAIFDVGGLPCEYGSPIFKGRIPAADCPLVARFRSLGAIVAGMTHTTSFAYFDPAPTRNPRNPAHTPGGSSSGSAAAVAAGMVPFAIGSQTQGSVIRPASFCGIVGFKPTHGALPMEGVIPFAPILDTAGLFTRDVETMMILWGSLGYDFEVELTPSFAAFEPSGDLHPAMRQAFLAAAERIGARMVKPPPSFLALPSIVKLIQDRDGARSLREIYFQHGTAVGAKLAEMIERGLSTPDEKYEEARAGLDLAKHEMTLLFGDYDVILTPAAPGPAPEGLASTGDPRMNSPWTGLGTPAITVPAPAVPDQLPLGLQLAAARNQEALLLNAACIIEKCA
jgi:Asp-tRNA(Asn)/Glu-tRNA(Gln) amidotransferase A subunit family amidase